MKRNFFIFLTFFITLCTLHFTHYLYADTIYTKDGQEMKGIVVEDYRDRLLFSTVDGEITVMKSDVRELDYDSEEENLIKLAEQATARRDYSRAFAYYNIAARKNPESKAAKDGLVFLQGYLYRKEEVKKEDDIRRRQEFESYGTVLGPDKTGGEELKESIGKLKDSMGVVLAMKAGVPEIETVEKDSPAYEAGMWRGDRLVAVWSKLTGYMSLSEVLAVLLDKPSLEIKCTMERTLSISVNPNRGILSGPNDLIGASLAMEFDGLTVSGVKENGSAYEAGLKKDDLVVFIDGNTTRYMPLKKAIELIRNSKGDTIKLTIRKELLIWRKS